MISDDQAALGASRPDGSLFSRFGVELEYMIVDAASLDVRPIADEVLRDAAGEITGELERGPVTWSNELVAHVIELKVTDPTENLALLPGQFQQSVQEIDRLLAPFGARLMPAGMHPWMDPLRHTKLWAHEFNEVYEAFDRIFGCQGHGWSNLQSVHLNLPFANDDEFARLHAAIRLVLPILPALTASSPVYEGRLSGLMDTRLEAYRTNSRKIPAIAGRVIPEPVFSRADYEREIFARLYAAVAPHDPEGTLQFEWLNARGAIARFMRNTIEIRVMDVQECPRADVAICAAVVAVLRALAGKRLAPLPAQQASTIDLLEPILLATIRDADEAVVSNRSYLQLFNLDRSECTAGELWRHLIDAVTEMGLLEARWRPDLDVILHEGPLARRLTTALRKEASPTTAGAQLPLRPVYSRLCDSLHTGELFRP